MIENKEQFKEFRVNNGYTQKEFAAALGFSEDYISAIERGTRPLNEYICAKVENLRRPAATLKVVIDEADEKNKRVAAEELKTYGDEYIDCMEKIEEARLTMKDIIDSAREKGISKDMIIAYCTTKTLTEFNKKIIKSAIF